MATLVELKAKAKKMGYKGYSRMKKAEIEKLLQSPPPKPPRTKSKAEQAKNPVRQVGLPKKASPSPKPARKKETFEDKIRATMAAKPKTPERSPEPKEKEPTPEPPKPKAREGVDYFVLSPQLILRANRLTTKPFRDAFVNSARAAGLSGGFGVIQRRLREKSKAQQVAYIQKVIREKFKPKDIAMLRRQAGLNTLFDNTEAGREKTRTPGVAYGEPSGGAVQAPGAGIRRN